VGKEIGCQVGEVRGCQVEMNKVAMTKSGRRLPGRKGRGFAR